MWVTWKGLKGEKERRNDVIILYLKIGIKN